MQPILFATRSETRAPHRRTRSSRLALPAIAAAALLCLPAPGSRADERALEDEPAPAAVEEIESPLERAYPPPPERGSLFPAVRRRTEGLTPFLADTQLYLRYRTVYHRLDRARRPLAEAWAMGGSVYYRSGWLFDVFSAELEGFTSQPIIAPEGADGTLLLKPGQAGYSVLGVANASLRYGPYSLRGYRQKLEHPYLNRQDNRMTPNTFEALKLAKETGRLRLAGGYAWRFKARNSDRFVPMSQRAGVDEERGAAFWSLVATPGEDFHVGTSGFVVPDVLATVYAETHYDLALGHEIGVRLDAQFTSQNTLGDELLAGAPFYTFNVGLRASASWRGLVGRIAFSLTGDERRIESFYGSNPTYVSLMQRTFNRAGERALLASLSYDFSALGIRGLSAIANYAQGWEGRTGGLADDAKELNVTVDYRIRSGILESFWLRLRGSWHEAEASPGGDSEIRVILRYELPVM